MHQSTAGRHGTSNAKGCTHLRLGNFCKLFPDLTPRPVTEEEAELLGGADGIMHDRNGESPDSELPAGYTFFSQLIDHDITLDTATNLHGETLPVDQVCDLPNLRSASLDLDCVYGFGPEASPFLYDQASPGYLLTGNEVNADDLPRNSEGRALIGDPRNDENLFVSQLQLTFLRFHNRRMVGRSFEQAQRDVRYHYQYLVLYDFLKRICNPVIYEYALKELADDNFPKKFSPDTHGALKMPVEFSGAAYRFGHSLVRSSYAANSRYPVVDLFDEGFETLGFSAVPPELTVDWRFLLDIEQCHPYLKGKAFDHLFADELISMPDPVVGRRASPNERSLAFRNLLRGNVYGLPSGQDLAKALKAEGYDVDPGYDLKFGEIDGWAKQPGDIRKGFEKNTPLFFYIMREAGVKGGRQLGRVGSAVLMEVFGGMLVNCENSYVKEEGLGWTPDACIAVNGAENFSLADLVRYANAE